MIRYRKIMLLAGLVVLAVVLGGLLYVYDPSKGHVFPPCPFHKLTGLYCSGCGSLRSLHQLFHGNIATAFGLNCLMVLSLPFAGYGLLAQGLRYFFNVKIPTIFIPAKWIWMVSGLIIAYAVARNIPVSPFTCLAP